MNDPIDYSNNDIEMQCKNGLIYISTKNMKRFTQFAKLKRTSFLNQIFQFERKMQVECCYDFTAANRTDGMPVFFGDNRYGQCTVPDLGGRKAIAIACGYGHSAMLLEDGTPLFFGDNDYGKCTVPDLGGRKAIAIACGLYHSAIVLEDDQIFLFGSNNLGQCDDTILKPEYVPFKKIGISPQEPQSAESKFKGTVTFYNSEKGYGFIKPCEQGHTQDVLVHQTQICMEGFRHLVEGSLVE